MALGGGSPRQLHEASSSRGLSNARLVVLSGHRPATVLEQELSEVVKATSRLTAAIAAGGDLPSLVSALENAREQA